MVFFDLSLESPTLLSSTCPVYYSLLRFLAGMSPLAHPNECGHSRLEAIARFKDGNEIVYRCLTCHAIVSSNELKPRQTPREQA